MKESEDYQNERDELKMMAQFFHSLGDACERMAEGEEPRYNSNITLSQMRLLKDQLSEVTSPVMSTEETMDYLHIQSRATFYNRLREGKIPAGKKRSKGGDMLYNKHLIDKLVHPKKAK